MCQKINRYIIRRLEYKKKIKMEQKTVVEFCYESINSRFYHDYLILIWVFALFIFKS